MIGGSLDYRRLAELHRPKSVDGIAAEVRRLHSTGLSELDVSVALRIDLAAVREALREAAR